MANSIAHELAEAVTDPEGLSWYDNNTRCQEEMGDKCAFEFGNNLITVGPNSNVILGRRNFYLQQLWLNQGSGKCTLSFGMPNWWPTIPDLLD
jgi:hypothetical protein